jgi:hypothetical protein
MFFVLAALIMSSDLRAAEPAPEDICEPAVEKLLVQHGCNPEYVSGPDDNGLAAIHCDGEAIFVSMEVEKFMVWRFSETLESVNSSFERAWSRNQIEVMGTIDNTVVCSRNGYRWWLGRNTKDRLPKLAIWTGEK